MERRAKQYWQKAHKDHGGCVKWFSLKSNG